MAAEPRQLEVGGEPVIRGEVGGEGPAVVLCHGITATRRYVVHGSRVLERGGHRVVAYDARGHGESDPAPAGSGYGYPDQVDDLERVVADALGDGGRFVLAGHSMGSHAAVAYALRRPERLAGLAVIGPVYTGVGGREALPYWDGLADALDSEGIEGFLDYLGRESETAEAWRESVLRFTRERMLAHRDLAAVVAALREVPRSRPFGSLQDLEGLEVPALVVGSGDEADPGHPWAVAEAYAERLPRARLVGEAEGESPLAWQGGRLSREIAGFCAEIGHARE